MCRVSPGGGLARPRHQHVVRRLGVPQGALTAAAEGIQLHGGIGFTWEHEAHLYFKRAAGDELLFGPVHRLRGHAADEAELFELG